MKYLNGGKSGVVLHEEGETKCKVSLRHNVMIGGVVTGINSLWELR
jgi:hypothetical protein